MPLPLKVMAPPKAPSAASELTLIVPALNTVPPEYPFAPVSVVVFVPVFTSVRIPGPLSLIGALMVMPWPFEALRYRLPEVVEGSVTTPPVPVAIVNRPEPPFRMPVVPRSAPVASVRVPAAPV